jgi:hypothetical protein
MRKLVLLLVAIASMGMIGCAGQSKLMKPMVEVDQSLSSGEAAVVFSRYAFAGGFGTFEQVPVIEAGQDGKLHLVGILSPNTKIHHRTKPGRHLYFLGSFGSNIVSLPMMEANMEAGRTYYAAVFVQSTYGLLPSGEFTPYDFNKAGDVQTLTWKFNSCRWVENTPQGQDWLQSNLPSLQDKYDSFLKEFQKKKPEARTVIKPEYGTKTPI